MEHARMSRCVLWKVMGKFFKLGAAVKDHGSRGYVVGGSSVQPEYGLKQRKCQKPQKIFWILTVKSPEFHTVEDKLSDIMGNHKRLFLLE